MERTLYKLTFTKDRSPDWKCPTCRVGLLRIVPKSFFHEETTESKRAKAHEAWDPDWIRYVFTALLRCTNDQCEDKVGVCGEGSVAIDLIETTSGEPEQVYADFFRAKFFEPPLRFFDVPDKCPETVVEPLVESFRLAFSSPSSAANHVRRALEALLTELHVKRYITKSGKRTFLSLHTRIGLLPGKFAEQKDMLLALKWLGNAGSHSSADVTLDDVMDAYELIQHVLEEVYASKTKKLKALAKKVNKKKGPAK